MPFYPVLRILDLYPDDETAAAALYASQQFDKTKIDELVLEFGTDQGRADASKQVLLTMLRHIPPDKQRRVINRIKTVAEEQGFIVFNMRWWDIDPRWRNLVFDISRDGYVVPVTLMWRKTDPDAPTMFKPSFQWIKHQSSSFGYGVEFHAEFYQHLRPQLLAWLEAPLQFPDMIQQQLLQKSA